MLGPGLRQLVVAEAARHPTPRAAVVPVLLLVQRHRGWIADDDLRETAGLLALDPAQLDELATFYDKLRRRPVGARVVAVCDSVSCWIAGGDAVLATIEGGLGVAPGETTADGAFTLVRTCCLGACDAAPVALVGEDLCGPLDAAHAVSQIREASRD